MFNRRYKWAAILTGAIALTMPANAGPAEHPIVDALIEAYGGDTFERMESITMYSDLRFGWVGQGFTPEYVEIPPMRKIYKINLKAETGSEEAWAFNNGLLHVLEIFTDTGQTSVNFATGTYSENPDSHFYDHMGGEIWTSDTLLAYEMMKRRDSVEHLGEVNFLGRPHDTLSMVIDGSEVPLTVYVDQLSGLISKADRRTGMGLTTFYFADYRETEGVTYAKEFVYYVNDDIIEWAMDRTIGVNDVEDSALILPAGLKIASESLNTSQLTVDEITPNLHLVGRGWGYNAFIDAGEYLISVGGTGGLRDRYDAYTEENGEKTLRYQVIADHHANNLYGLDDALAMGVTLVAPQSAVETIQETASEVIEDSRIRIIESGFTLGPVQIELIDTNHAIEVAVVYMASAKTLIQGHLYRGNLTDSVPNIPASGVDLANEVTRLGLDVDVLLSHQSRKAEDWDAFMRAAADFSPDPCPTGRDICKD